jgi:hypothetical protein
MGEKGRPMHSSRNEWCHKNKDRDRDRDITGTETETKKRRSIPVTGADHGDLVLALIRSEGTHVGDTRRS